MRKSVWTVALSFVLVTGFIMVGCGGSGTTTAPTTSPTAAPAKTGAPAPAATPSPPAKAAATTAASGKVYNLKFSYHTPEKASVVPSYFQPWTAAIEKSSNGGIKITHYPGESLVKAPDQYDSLVAGLSDIALIETDITPGRFPSTEFFALPFLAETPAVTAAAYYDTVMKYSLNELKEVKVLAAVTISGAHYVGNKPFKTLDDFKGQRMRTGAANETDIIKQLGATPVEIATSDLTTAFERKMVDSAFLSASAILSFGVKDVTTYRTRVGVFTRSWLLCMNKKVWESLPPDLQKAFTDNSGAEKSKFYSAENDKLEAGAFAAIAGSDKGQGKPEIHVLPNDEKAKMKAALQPVTIGWVEKMRSKIPSPAIIEDFNAFAKKHSSN